MSAIINTILEALEWAFVTTSYGWYTILALLVGIAIGIALQVKSQADYEDYLDEDEQVLEFEEIDHN